MGDIFAEEFGKHTFVRSQEKIAKYCVERQYLICQESLHDFAEGAGVSEVSVLNFVRKLGYEGFAEFKNKVYQRMVQEVGRQQEENRNLQERMESNQKKRKPGSLRDSYYQTAVDVIEGSLSQNSEKLYERVIGQILNSKKIFVVGTRNLNGEAERFFLGLSYLVDYAYHIAGDYNNILQQLSSARKGDTLIFMCQSRYFKMDVAICDMAKKNGLHIILMSDRNISPISVFADEILTFITDSTSFFSSIVGLAAVYEYLFTELAERLGGKPEKRWNQIDQYTEEFRL